MSTNNTDDTEVMQQDGEVVDETETTDLSGQDDQENQQQAEDGTDWKAEALKYKAILDRKAKSKPEPAQAQSTNNTPSVDPDELRLLAKGLSDEEIEQAKVIAKGMGKSLQEAIKSPLFTSFQKDLKDQERKEKAKLGASKGSSQVAEPAIKPDMSRDEHKAAWMKTMGR